MASDLMREVLKLFRQTESTIRDTVKSVAKEEVKKLNGDDIKQIVDALEELIDKKISENAIMHIRCICQAILDYYEKDENVIEVTADPDGKEDECPE